MSDFVSVSVAQQWKSIDKNTKCLVSGYIREFQPEFPIEIIKICTVYYYQTGDAFCILSERMKGLIKKKHSAQTVREYEKIELVEPGWRSAFGSFIVDPVRYNGLVYEWNILLGGKSISVGLTSTEFSDPEQYCFTGHSITGDHHYYALANHGGIECHDLELAKGVTRYLKSDYRDMVSVIFDTKKGSISFMKNKQNLKMVSDKVDLTKQYRLAVCMYKVGSTCTVESFLVNAA